MTARPREGVIDAIAHIAKVVRSKGLIAGVHTDGHATAKKRFEQGYSRRQCGV